MKFILNLMALIFLSSNCTSQTVTFQKTFGGADPETSYSVQQISDGGYVLVGATKSFGTSLDAYIIRLDSNGDTLWTRIFGGTASEGGKSVQQTSDGGFVICGTTQSFGAGGNDVYLTKIDSTGSILWFKTFGGTRGDFGETVKKTSDGGFIINGSTDSFGPGGSDVYVIKTDSSGDTLWTKTYGGSDNDYGNSIQQAGDGGFIIMGTTHSFGTGISDLYLTKTDSSGNAKWSKTFGGTYWDEGFSVEQTNDEGYILLGHTLSFGNSSGTYLLKVDTIGNLMWSKTYNDTASGYYGFAMRETTDFGYIITGKTSSGGDAYLLKVDNGGDVQWAKSYGTATESNYVQQTSDAGFVITGFMAVAGNFSDVYLVKTDSSGNSNCNDLVLSTIQNSPPTLSTVATTIASSTTTQVSSPSLFAVSLATITKTLCSTASSEQNATNDLLFTIYPNPSSGNISIKAPQFNIASITVYNILGEEIYKKAQNDNSKIENYNFSSFSGGVYFILVNDGHGKESTNKLFIQK